MGICSCHLVGQQHLTAYSGPKPQPPAPWEEPVVTVEGCRVAANRPIVLVMVRNCLEARAVVWFNCSFSLLLVISQGGVP
jgi:hypothetical protein